MGHPSTPFYQDGDYDTPVRISRTIPEFPFRQNGDIVTKTYVARYLVNILKFVPTVSGAEDPENAGFFLLTESRPDIFQGKLATFERVYSNVPLEQTVPSSLRISKPALSGEFPQVVGSYVVFQPDTSLLKFDAYARRGVTSDSGAGAGFYPTGGTWTITFLAATTSALDYDASASDVQTALNALTPISDRGGVVVTGTYNSPGGFTITFNGYATGTLATGSLTGHSDSSINSVVTPTNEGYTQNITMTRVNGTLSSPSASFNNVDLTVSSGSISVGGPQYGIQNRRIGFGVTSTGGAFNGGTYTLSMFGQTTAAIAYNASFAAIQSALNALSNITARGGVTVGPNIAFPGASTPLSTGAIRFDVSFPDGRFTGGTFTISLFGQTTAGIAHNANAAAVEAALELLSEVQERGGCTVSGVGLAPDGRSITFGISFANPVVDADPTALTPGLCAIVETIEDNVVGRVQKLVFAASSSTRDLFVAEHGIALSDALAIRATVGDDSIWYNNVPFTIPDPNTIRIVVADGTGYESATAITEVGRRTKTGYEPGSVERPVKRISTFYLPGETPGIDDADDIPIPEYQGDSATLLQAIFSGSGVINIEVAELQPWRESAILVLTRTTVNVALL